MIAKNNIFNIRYSSSNSWKGQDGKVKGFCRFKSVEFCVRAMIILLRVYRLKYGLKTIRSIISRFAPDNENDTDSYIGYVSTRMCVGPDYELDTSMDYVRLMKYMALMETGYVLNESYVIDIMCGYNISPLIVLKK